MKIILYLIIFLTLASCSSFPLKPKTLPAFDSKVNCTPKSLIYLDQSLQNDRRSMTEKIKGHQRFANFVKPKLDAVQSCYLKDLDKYKSSDYKFNVCMVVELNEESNISFLEIEDNNNPLPASLSKCLYDIFEIMDYKNAKGPGVFSHSFKLENKKASK